tara:strand:- start:693 stop:986 length:294 start_codon:yes stop_codon:yes gene_type:complete
MMQKGYILFAHRSPADPEKREAYIKLAFPAIKLAGGKVLAQSKNVIVKENGINERTILVEFDTLEKAINAYNSKDYQEALKVLDNGSDRDVRIFEGI